MAKQLTSMYQKDYEDRVDLVNNIVMRFRFSFTQLAVFNMLALIPTKLLKVISSHMHTIEGLTDEEKLKDISKFIKERVYDE